MHALGCFQSLSLMFKWPYLLTLTSPSPQIFQNSKGKHRMTGINVMCSPFWFCSTGLQSMLPRDSYFQFQIKKHKQWWRFYPRHPRDQKSKGVDITLIPITLYFPLLFWKITGSCLLLVCSMSQQQAILYLRDGSAQTSGRAASLK